MRLSFGQEMRLVQKQVLAPRMIQSMEILQLPIMALQERIEQEIQENPVLDLQEEDLDLPEQPADQENPNAPTAEERELVVDDTKNNEDDFERLLNMDEEWPDHFEERTRPSSTRLEEEGQRKHDAMANMVARPQSLQDYLHDQLGWFEIEPEVRQMCDRIIYNLDANGYLQGRIEDLIDPEAPPEQLGLAQRALAVVQKLDPPGVAARDLRECLWLQLTPGMPYYEQLKTLITNHLEDLEHNRLPLIERRTGYSIALDSANARRAAQAESEAGRQVRRELRAECHSRCVRRSRGRRRLQNSARRRPHAQLVHQPLLPQAAHQRRSQRRDARIHQAQDQLGPVADRIDRAAPQHAHPRGPGDRRSSNRVSQQRARVHRAAQDAADRRQGEGACHDREPGGGRQMDPDTARHLSAQAVLLRRHSRAPMARKSLGTPCGSSCKKSSMAKASKAR